MSENNSSLTYPVFKLLSSQDAAESKKQGRPVFHDTEVCEIRFSGNKQTVGVFPAHEQCEWGEDPLTQERVRLTYAQKYNEQYKKFKAGEAQAATGTPLEELPFLTQAKRLELKALNIYTAESLAALDGNNLRMLGMGGRDLKSQAQFYLDNAAKTVDAAGLAAENEDLKKRLAALEKAMGTGTPVPKKGKGKAAAPVEETKTETASTPDPDNPFNDWDAEDIALWINDTDPEVVIDETWGKDTLAETAKEINDAIAAAKSKG